MKHKLKITILSILFGLLFGIPVYADSNTYIIDQSDVLGEYISTLNEKAETISEEAGLRITCMITNTTEGMGTPAVSEQVYKGLFADDPGFMLIYSIDDQEWFFLRLHARKASTAIPAAETARSTKTRMRPLLSPVTGSEGFGFVGSVGLTSSTTAKLRSAEPARNTTVTLCSPTVRASSTEGFRVRLPVAASSV